MQSSFMELGMDCKQTDDSINQRIRTIESQQAAVLVEMMRVMGQVSVMKADLDAHIMASLTRRRSDSIERILDVQSNQIESGNKRIRNLEEFASGVFH